MAERPDQPPEGALIAQAQKRARLSNRKAAAKVPLSEGHWRAIVSGSRSISAGVWVPVHGPAETLARMAQAVGVTPEQLAAVGRDDAADELRQLLDEPNAGQVALGLLADAHQDFDAIEAELDRRLREVRRDPDQLARTVAALREIQADSDDRDD